MTENKTAVPQETRLEKFKVKTKKGNKSLLNISMSNIIELNKLIYADSKVVCD